MNYRILILLMILGLVSCGRWNLHPIVIENPFYNKMFPPEKPKNNCLFCVDETLYCVEQGEEFDPYKEAGCLGEI